MKSWEELKSLVWKKTPNKEKAKALLKLVHLRLEEVDLKDKIRFATIVVKDYYEIIDHLLEALMELDGYKTLSHEAKIAFLAEFYSKDFSKAEVLLIDRLRIMRNRIAYEGAFVRFDFLERNEKKIRKIIGKLIRLVKSKVFQGHKEK